MMEWNCFLHWKMFLKKLNFDETNENENANMENINSMHGS